jgi:hypothetical protein
MTFSSTKNLLLLFMAGIIGVISPSGNGVGPFLSIEQAALSHVISQRSRTEVLAWYTLIGSLATPLGALSSGAAVELLQKAALPKLESYRAVVLLYAVLGSALAWLLTRLSSATEVYTPAPQTSKYSPSSRTAGAAITPLFAGFLFSRPSLVDVPFFLAGALKILYDLVLYRQFIALRPPEEVPINSRLHHIQAAFRLAS